MRDARCDGTGWVWVATHRAGSALFIGVLVLLRLVTSGLRCVADAELRLYIFKVEHDQEARSAALSLLSKGMVTPSQAAALAGVSAQLVAYWMRAAGIDWRRAWLRRQASIWRREIAALNGKVMRPPSKKELHRRAKRAKVSWDASRAPKGP